MSSPSRTTRLLRVVINPAPDDPGAAIATGGQFMAAGILQRAGFLPGPTFSPGAPFRLDESAEYRLPNGLSRPERDLAASRAAVALTRAGITVDLHPALAVPVAQPLPPVHTTAGQQTYEHADRIRYARDTSDMASLLAEITAPGDGVLYAASAALTATADWAADFGERNVPRVERLHELAEQIQAISREVSEIRSGLTKDYEAHPLRGLRGPGEPPDPRMVAGPHPDHLRPYEQTECGSKEHSTAWEQDLAAQTAEVYAGIAAGHLVVDWHYVEQDLGHLLTSVTDERTGAAMHIIDEGGVLGITETFPSRERATAAFPRLIEGGEPLSAASPQVLDEIAVRAAAATTRSARASQPREAPLAPPPAIPFPPSPTRSR
ncbi:MULTISPECIES: hypothetical protein [unclassified Kitasatospora]|uniref:hypothetical protein n=1 Tax=unclassified Kitasatospora TaxID=2633591 RepID=UPI000A5B27BF|nr:MULTISPECIES: hypothetical protein [unclassified Kitasatospora]